MKSIIFSIAILIFVFSITNCGNSKSTTVATDPLYHNEWKLTEVQGQPVMATSQSGLQFAEGKVSGSTGCNRLTGSFELGKSNSIKFSPQAVTQMACLDADAGAIETKFLDALSKATTWNISNDELFLGDGTATIAKLKAFKQLTGEAAMLNGTWELNYISGPKIAFDALFPDNKPTLVINLPNKEATGNGGCNTYRSEIKVNGNNISFENPIATFMACKGNGEKNYFKTLKKITSYSVSDENNTLTLLMGDIALMRFAKK